MTVNFWWVSLLDRGRIEERTLFEMTWGWCNYTTPPAFKSDALFFCQKRGKIFPLSSCAIVYDMAGGCWRKKLAEWGELIFMEHLPSNYRYVFFSTLWSLYQAQPILLRLKLYFVNWKKNQFKIYLGSFQVSMIMRKLCFPFEISQDMGRLIHLWAEIVFHRTIFSTQNSGPEFQAEISAWNFRPIVMKYVIVFCRV